jgi:N-acetylglucosamine-6-phosphate deacetylase
MKQVLINGRVLTPGGWRDECAVLVENGRITGLDASAADGERHDLGGRYLLPGFIDVQVNGGGGVLFNDEPTVAGVRAIAAAHRRFGTTGLLPTLISDDKSVMPRAVAAVNAAIADAAPGILGIHLEGPFITRKGVHDPRWFRVPDATDVAAASALEGGRAVVTLAPEHVPDDVLRAFIEAGVIVCAGHTAADYTATRAGIDNGIRGFTHLYNAMTPLTSREPGVVGAALEDRESWCGVIVDNHHVHPASLQVALAAKPTGKLFLVTDAMPPVGAADPSFVLKGETITARNGICETADGVIAGSALTMIDAVRNCVETLGLSLAEAARMASTYPADFLGLAASHGRIAPGRQADFTVIDDNFDVHETWIDGQCERHADG